MIDALGVIGTIIVFCLGVVGISVFGAMILVMAGCTYESDN